MDAQPTLETQLGSMAGFQLASYVNTLKLRSVKYIPPFLSDAGKRLLRESIPVRALASDFITPNKARPASSLAFLLLFKWAKQHLWDTGNENFQRDNWEAYGEELEVFPLEYVHLDKVVV